MIKEFPAEVDSIPKIMDFINEQGKIYNLHDKEIRQAQLMSEECIKRLLEHKDSDTNIIRAKINKFLGNVQISIYVKGSKFDFADSLNPGIELLNQENMSIETADAISNLIMKAFANKLSYHYYKGINKIRITASQSPYIMLYVTLLSLTLAIITGLLMKNFAPEYASISLNEYFLSPVRKIFLNGLAMSSVGIIFFSLASCVANLGGMSELKKVGSVLIISYIIMHIAAILISIFTFFEFQSSFTAKFFTLPFKGVARSTSGSPEISIIDTITNLMPDNIIKPFLNNHLLQLVLLAVIIGYAANSAGANLFKKFIDECNNVFMQIINILMAFIPLFVFCSITSLILTVENKLIFSLIDIVGTLFTINILTLLLFLIVTIIICRINPLKIFAKSTQMILTSFSTCSNNAAIQDSINAAKNMGVDSKIYSLSIPLGTAINKTGICITLAAGSLAVAHIYGVDTSMNKALSMIFPVIIMTVASPPIGGGEIISFAALLAMLGAPSEAVSLYIVIDPIVDLFATITVSLCNIFATLIAASSENMLDRKIFNS